MHSGLNHMCREKGKMGTQLKGNYVPKIKHEPFYTGGKVQFTEDGDFMLCQCGEQVHILSVESGKPETIISNDEGDAVTSFVLSPDGSALVVASQSLQLKQWDWKNNNHTRTWKAIHTAPISCMSFDVTSTLLATGGADASIKVWDVVKQYCTHNLKGHQGVVSIAEFHPDIDRLQLYSAADDYNIRVWNLKNSKCLAVLEGHYSVVTSLQFCDNVLYSGGRDNVVNVWDITNFTKTKTIPIYESVEGLILLPTAENPSLDVQASDAHFVTAGSKGVLKVWNSQTAACVFTQQNSISEVKAEGSDDSPQQAIVDLSVSKKSGTFNVITYDHNIIQYGHEDFTLKKQFVGYNDDILDMKLLGEDESHLAVATNSDNIKVFELASWSCQILRGHSDIVLCLDVYKAGSILVSSSKDNSIRVWCMSPTTGQMTCIAVGNGHTHAVAAVAFAKVNPSFIVSGSEDLTLKKWLVPEELDLSETITLSAQHTEKAHDKDINAITVSPNDKVIATGSQDRTAKLWSAADLTLLGVFRGHKRGIWCIQFSPVDQCLATGSADGTIKMWALADFSCVKTFEGHDASVLRLSFLTRGMQIMSSGSDGLLKLWTVKTNECVKTLDEHEDKAWALTVSHTEQTIITGAADSNIIVWQDVTETELEEIRAKQHDQILKEQELSNLLLQKKYLKAIGLAITLEQPYRVLTIMKEMMATGETGKADLATTINKLRDDQLDSILRYCVSWNTNSRHCHEAQFVLSIILKSHPPEDLMKLANFKDSLEGLLPYTERHMTRMNKLKQQTTFITYTWHSMAPVGGSTGQMTVPLGIDSIPPKSKDTRKKSPKKQENKDEKMDVEELLGISDNENPGPSKGKKKGKKKKKGANSQLETDEKSSDILKMDTDTHERLKKSEEVMTKETVSVKTSSKKKRKGLDQDSQTPTKSAKKMKVQKKETCNKESGKDMHEILDSESGKENGLHLFTQVKEKSPASKKKTTSTPSSSPIVKVKTPKSLPSNSKRSTPATNVPKNRDMRRKSAVH